MTNWADPKSLISKYFTVEEALFLPSFKCLHTPSLSEQDNIANLAITMDKVREYLGKPIKVHVWIRPTAVNCPSSTHNGEDYNARIGGAKHSAHISGRAVDWSVPGKSCDEVRNKLISKLQELGLRMEDLPGSSWVHLDTAPPGPSGHRFFVP
jgi:Peptidase M15